MFESIFTNIVEAVAGPVQGSRVEFQTNNRKYYDCKQNQQTNLQ